MNKAFKFILGVLLLPLCVAATQSVVALLQLLKPDDVRAVPLAAWWLAGGFAFWLILFYALPRPTRTYVLAHELTHAIWGLLMGATISKIKVSKNSGYVSLSKTNFLIGLAPYFFPFYTMCVILVYFALSFFIDMGRYELFWLAAVGLTWGFHLTFTIATLMTHQPDITEHGRLFSYTVIYLFNILGIGLWIVAVTPVVLAAWSESILGESRSAYLAAWQGLEHASATVLAFFR
ncbi:MAG: hypothetical protein V1929_03945 [bacterium]